jgi:hypothetical protein
MMSVIGSMPTSLTGATGVLVPVVLGIALWLGVVALIGTFGGWGAVARDYPAPEPPTAGERVTVSLLLFGRGMMSLGNYRYAVTLIVTPHGFELRTKPLFQFQHPGIAVPWREVRAYEKGTSFGWPFIELMLSRGQHLRMRGRAATALIQALARAAARGE